MTPTPLTPELMDHPDLPLAQTERALRDLERVHRWLGNGALWRLLEPALVCGERHPRVLDVGTGNGAVATRIIDRASRRAIEVRAVGLDRKLAHLLLGREHGARHPCVVGDARALPFADGSFAVSFSTLFQHHFLPEPGARVLAEMRRVASRAAIVVDIRRSRLGGLLGRCVLFLLRLGPVARFDGRLSLDQSWTVDEARQAAPAGAIRSLARCWPFRWALELAPSPPSAQEGTD